MDSDYLRTSVLGDINTTHCLGNGGKATKHIYIKHAMSCTYCKEWNGSQGDSTFFLFGRKASSLTLGIQKFCPIAK